MSLRPLPLTSGMGSGVKRIRLSSSGGWVWTWFLEPSGRKSLVGDQKDKGR